ncbi:PAS domain S-box protein [Skermanella rosea]|uniref:PAS domain S-box protein n=1 Tax=Skermanella rosea TaxID=1817965 RepID=UPI00193299E9|nr:PAS domain S-box protein [Skermanella rosea]UEM01926.1 PAS domain S-box protein [Skermanella rosea]
MFARCPPQDLRAILDLVGSPAFVIDASAGAAVLAVNARLETALGRVDPACLSALVGRAADGCSGTGQPVEIDVDVALDPKRESWHLVLVPIPLDGDVVRIMVTVTARSPASSWTNLDSRTQAIIEEQAGLVVRYRPDTTLTFANAAYARRFGAAPDDLVGRRIVDLVSPQEVVRIRACLADLTPDRPVGRHERPVTLPDGTVRWLLWSDRAFHDGEGRPVEYQSVGFDITRHKQVERELQDSRDFFRLAIEGTRDGLWDWDLRTGTIWLSPRLKEILGFADDELPNDLEALQRLVLPEDRERALHRIQRHWDDGKPYEQTVRFIHRDGTIRHILARGGSVRDPDGKPIRMVGVHTDVTLLVESGQMLRLAKEQAEQASRAKSEFLALMSHELRTPLNAIIGFAEILRDELFGPLGNERYGDYVQDIVGSGRHLLALISDILDLSRIDAGQLALREATLDLALVARGQIQLAAAAAEAGGVTVLCDAGQPGPLIRADEARIRQIVQNLLSNAVKFTPAGGTVRLDARVGPDESVVLRVSDTGIGMRLEDVPRALEPFSQLEASLTRRREGTGLGLAIVKRLVELHDGELRIETAPDEGSTVTVIFPRERNAGVPESQVRRSPAGGEPVGLVPWSGALFGRFELLDTLLQAVPMAVAVTREDGICIKANHTLCRMSGFEMVELLGRPIETLLAGEAAAAAQPGPPPGQEAPRKRTRLRERQLVTRFGRTRGVEVIREPFVGLDGQTYVLLLLTDVSERRRTAKALRDSEERFRLAASAAGCGIWDADLVTGDRWFSPAYLHMLGYGEDELTLSDAAWRERIHPDDRAGVDEALAGHLTGGNPFYEVAFRMRHKSGRWIWLVARGAASFDAGGEARRFVGTISDITVEVEAREALAEKSAFLETVLSNIGQGIVVFDAERRVRLVNDRFLALHGFPRDLGAPGTPIERLVRWRVEQSMALAEGTDATVLDARTAEDMVWLDRWLSAPPPARVDIGGHGGRILDVWRQDLPDGGFVATQADVTARRRAEFALAQREDQLRTILRVALVGILTVREDGAVEEFNPTAESMFGWSAAELRGRDVGVLLAEETLSGAAALSLLQPDPKAGDPGGGTEFLARRRDGSAFPARISMAAFTAGGCRRYVGVVADISAKRTVEAELRAARTRLDQRFDDFVRVSVELEQVRREADMALLHAEQSSKAKSEFLAQMSHELRTPLNAVIGFSEIMKGQYFGPLGSPKYQEYAEDIDQCGRHLLSLINDILDLSKVEAGRYVLEEEQIDLCRIVDASVRLLRDQAAGKGVMIALRPEPVPAVMGDQRALKQVVVNLLSNAVKFTPRGGMVEIGTLVDAFGDVCITVKDTGIGIPDGEIPRVLEAFGRASNVRQSGEEGTGLGLAIVGSFLSLHGATLDIDSAVGIGTTVTVRLPIERVLGTQRQLQPWDIVDDR